MRRILSLIAVVALMVAFAMPVMTAEAASHQKAKDTAEKMMDKSKDAGKKAMDKMTPENPCNPCAAKKNNPCKPGASKKQ
jgi:Tfp pilus assembly protein FimT